MAYQAFNKLQMLTSAMLSVSRRIWILTLESLDTGPFKATAERSPISQSIIHNSRISNPESKYFSRDQGHSQIHGFETSTHKT